MLDFTRIAESVGQLFGRSAEEAVSGATQQLGDLASVGSVLEGLDVAQLTDMLAEHGIDLQSLDPQQLTELAQAVTSGTPVAAVIEQLGLGRHG